MQTLIECVPNFSEGRDAKRIDAIIAALLAGPEVYLLGQEMDADHNRSVNTLVGTRESIGEAGGADPSAGGKGAPNPLRRSSTASRDMQTGAREGRSRHTDGRRVSV